LFKHKIKLSSPLIALNMSTNKGIAKVIFSSSLGTLIEWYDFYIFGMLAKTIASKFFPEGNDTAALLSTLAIFAAGFIVRPFGAIFFGRLGDLIGRKYTFLLTLVLMGGATFLIGLVPSYAAIGMASPILVLLLRLIQGLALGGEYGGAATYVAEHAPAHRRGYFTSWIQATATLGLFVALGVIMLVKSNMTDASFNADWGGWRYPFWFSILLVGVSIYIRLRMHESPLFAALKKEGKTSKNPLKESFGNKANFKLVLLALFGAVMGQGVIWYTGQFYAQSFLENTCGLDFIQSRSILLWAILFATPFFIFFGWLSDRIGRKWIMLIGMLLGVIFYRPIFKTFLNDTNTKAWAADTKNLKPVLQKRPERIMDSIKNRGNSEWILLQKFDKDWEYKGATFTEKRTDTINGITYDEKDELMVNVRLDAKPSYTNVKHTTSVRWKFIFLVWVMIVFVTMVYGPIAAFLVELFPTKIRYTSMSLPYHIGNGVFGGLVPFIATLLSTTYANNALVGLWYPIGIAALCFIIGAIYLKNKIDKNIKD
jgi:MFS family permease